MHTGPGRGETSRWVLRKGVADIVSWLAKSSGGEHGYESAGGLSVSPNRLLPRIDVEAASSASPPSKNPDVAAGHGPATSFNPGWNRLVSGVGALIRNLAAQWGKEAKQVSWE
jgi:hypothetical protein